MNTDYYMDLAIEKAKKAFKVNEVPVGAIIVFNNKIIVKAYNMSESLKNFTSHAELLALDKATKILDSKYLKKGFFY